MSTHKKFIEQMSEFLDGTLSPAEQKTFQAHLAACESCRTALDNFRQVKTKLKETTDAKLSPEKRLRLYETMNIEREKRGEKLLRIPAELLAQVKAKSAAAGQAAGEVTAGGVEAAADVAKSGASVGGAMAGGAKSVSGKMAKTAKKGVKRAQKMATETRKTVADIGRTMSEAAEIAGDIPKSPVKAVTAPPKLAGKGMKTGAKMAKGGAKVMSEGLKGSVEMMAGGAETAAEMMLQAGKVTKKMVDGIETTAAAKNKLADTVSKSAKTIADAEPESADDATGKA